MVILIHNCASLFFKDKTDPEIHEIYSAFFLAKSVVALVTFEIETEIPVHEKDPPHKLFIPGADDLLIGLPAYTVSLLS